jgi:DNA-binding MarR family transcriptional regulator
MSDLERQNTSQLLRLLYEAFIRRLFERLAELGFGDIHPAHAIVFQHLGRDGMRVTELAERAQLTKQYVGRLVAELEALGYLERASDPSDGRARLVRLSPRGEEVTSVAERAIAEIEHDWSRRVGPERYAELRSLLVDLSAALGV